MKNMNEWKNIVYTFIKYYAFCIDEVSINKLIDWIELYYMYVSYNHVLFS